MTCTALARACKPREHTTACVPRILHLQFFMNGGKSSLSGGKIGQVVVGAYYMYIHVRTSNHCG